MEGYTFCWKQLTDMAKISKILGSIHFFVKKINVSGFSVKIPTVLDKFKRKES